MWVLFEFSLIRLDFGWLRVLSLIKLPPVFSIPFFQTCSHSQILLWPHSIHSKTLSGSNNISLPFDLYIYIQLNDDKYRHIKNIYTKYCMNILKSLNEFYFRIEWVLFLAYRLDLYLRLYLFCSKGCKIDVLLAGSSWALKPSPHLKRCWHTVEGGTHEQGDHVALAASVAYADTRACGLWTER